MKYHGESMDGERLAFTTGRCKSQAGISQSPFSGDELHHPTYKIIVAKVQEIGHRDVLST